MSDAPPEAPPETPTPDGPEGEPEAPETPETPDESGDDSLEGREAKARREARNLRAKLRDLQAGQSDAIAKAVQESTAELADQIATLQGQLIERDAQLAAVGKFRNPRDVTHFIDVAATKPEQLDEVIAKVLKERPYLGIANGNAMPQGQQSEGRNGANGNADANDWLREQIMSKQAAR